MLSTIKVKVVSLPLKLLAVFIFLLVFCWSIYSYLFNQNPLKETSYSFISEKGLTINALDINKEKIYSLTAKPDSIIVANNLPNVVINAVLAVNYILNDSDKKCSPHLPLDAQLKNKCKYVYTDIIAKEYVLNNLIRSNLDRGDKSIDLFFKIKQYVVMKWLKKHFSINDFFTFFLNYSYYGDNIIGINDAINKFFLKKDSEINKLTPREAAFLAKKLYENNTYIYSQNSMYYDRVQLDNILNTMYDLGYISEKDLAKELHTRVHVKQSYSNTPYKMFSNSMISLSLPLTDRTNDITVYSTLNKRIQDALSTTLTSLASSYNIPHVSVYGVDNGKIVAGMSFDYQDNQINYQFRFPTLQVKYLLRPLLYLGLLHNDIKIPDTLINPEIQEVINDQNIAPSDLNKYFPAFSEKIGNINASNNNNIMLQQTALNKIAMQLVYLEKELFAKLDQNALTKLATELVLPKDSITQRNDEYYLSASFADIVNSYAVLNQGGKYYLPIYMTKINDEVLQNSTLFDTPFTSENINKTKSIIKTEEVLEQKYKVIYDVNTAIIFYKNYTFGIWLGDTSIGKEQNLNISRYNILQKLTQEIAGILISNSIDKDNDK